MLTDDSNAVYKEDCGIKYKLMTLPDFRHFRDMATGDSPEWSRHYEDDKTKVESKPPGDDSTKLNIIRVRRVMENVPPEVLYDQMHDADYRATWDNNMIEGYNIVRLDEHNDVGYYSAKFPWPLANRDFCNQRSWMEFTNGDYIIFNHSEPHNKCPPKKGFVRARSILTGYYIQPNTSGGSILTYVTHSDPCGAIPHAVLNFGMKKLAPMLLNNCEKCSEAYPEFARKQYPPGHVFAWRTPKMYWDSQFLNPADEERALKAARLSGQDNGADGTDTSNEIATGEAVTGGDNPSQPQTTGGGSAPPVSSGSLAPMVSLAPVAPMKGDQGLVVQQYRALLQDAMNAVDRSFLREGRAPTTREYIVRLKFALDGVRRTTSMP